MQSWSLKKFVDEHGPVAASKIWGKSHQAVCQALESNRKIKVVKAGKYYEVHEFKLLGRLRISKIDIDCRRERL